MPRPVIALLLAVALAALGCGAGSPPPPAPSATSPAAAPPTADPGSPAEPTVSPAGPTPTAADATTGPGGGPATDAPPVASLSVVDGDGTSWEGSLGTFTWRGVGSDSPWFVPASGASVPAGATLRIRFGDSDVVPVGWDVSWATVDGSFAGTVVGGARGTPGTPLRAPGEPGTYAVQVDADFGADRRAAWYWRVDVTP